MIVPSTISLEKYQFIRNEVIRWEEENLLSNGQGDRILARYSPPDWQHKSLVACSVLATVLLGWTVVMYIAANVQVIPLAVRLSFLLCFSIASFWTAWRLNSGQTRKSLFVDALIILGCLCYGAEIWLLAQALQCDLNYPLGPLVWGIGVLAVTFATRSSPAAILAVLLLQWYQFWALPNFFEGCAVLCASLYCAYLTRNAWAIAAALLGQTFWICYKQPGAPNAVLPVLILWGVSLVGWWVWHRYRANLQALGKPYLYLGVACTSIGLSLLPSFYASYSEFGFAQINYTADSIFRIQLAALNAAGVLIFVVLSEKKARFEFIAASLAYFGTLVIAVCNDPTMLAVNAIACSALMTVLLPAFAVYAIALDDIQLVVLTLFCGVFQGYASYMTIDGHARLLFFLICALAFLAAAFVFDRKYRQVRQQKETLLKLEPMWNPNEPR